MPTRAKLHRAVRPQQRVRPSSDKLGYDSSWKKLRLLKLMDSPFCECLDCTNKLTKATVVDHIATIADRPDLRLCWDNLRSMAKRCHDRHTRRVENAKLRSAAQNNN